MTLEMLNTCLCSDQFELRRGTVLAQAQHQPLALSQRCEGCVAPAMPKEAKHVTDTSQKPKEAKHAMSTAQKPKA